MRMLLNMTLPVVFMVGCQATFAQSIPIANLQHDGPATPEQLSLLLPVTGSLPQTANATVRYRQQGEDQWRTGHSLLRVRPDFSNSPSLGTVDDVFAWPIIDLLPGTTYQVEVTVSSSIGTDTRAATFTTRSLTPTAGAATTFIATGSNESQIQAVFDSLRPGDVAQFEDGTYDVDQLIIDRSGTRSEPIFIRGATRTGVVIRDSSGSVLRLADADHVVIENLTIQGSGNDGGTNWGHVGIYGAGNPDEGTVGNTIRNVTILGVDRGIVFYHEVRETLVYNNTLVGNNVWNAEFLGDNRTWNDDGINVPGQGNAVFNNTISGFGDSLAYANHVSSLNLTVTRGVHFYRNDIRNSLDDLVEVDHAQRNITFYDNRSHNSANCGSLDPLYGGPFIHARNICINPARPHIHKWNANNTGHFYYNNTFISTKTTGRYAPDVAGWYQPNNGAQRTYGYRNNILVYGGEGDTLLWLESTGHDPIDWSHNSWYPDREIQWGPRFLNLAETQRGLASTTPVFGQTNRRMEFDNITTANPWSTQITLGKDSLVEVSETYAPTLASGTAPENSGVPIPNITDGYSGPAPDRGALISGRALPSWGDPKGTDTPLTRPNPPEDLRTN